MFNSLNTYITAVLRHSKFRVYNKTKSLQNNIYAEGGKIYDNILIFIKKLKSY
jgi:hypothetical protein